MIAKKVVVFLIFVACFTARGIENGAAGTLQKDYTIGPEDLIAVSVLDSQDIPEKPTRVDLNGQISLPLIGRVQAAGQSVSDLEAAITERLRKYVINPQVSVNIIESASRPVSVLGAVTAPGIYQLGGEKTLAQVIALARGLAPDAGGVIRIAQHSASGASSASPNSGVIQVSVKELLSNSSAAASTPIRPNDVITVPKAALVYVIGEVGKPGAQTLNDRETITVLEAVSAAQGVLPVGSAQHAKLLRRDPATGQRTETALNVKKIMAGKGTNMVLQPDDIVLIPRNEMRAVGLKTVDAAISLGTGALIYR